MSVFVSCLFISHRIHVLLCFQWWGGLYRWEMCHQTTAAVVYHTARWLFHDHEPWHNMHTQSKTSQPARQQRRIHFIKSYALGPDEYVSGVILLLWLLIPRIMHDDISNLSSYVFLTSLLFQVKPQQPVNLTLTNNNKEYNLSWDMAYKEQENVELFGYLMYRVRLRPKDATTEEVKASLYSHTLYY